MTTPPSNHDVTDLAGLAPAPRPLRLSDERRAVLGGQVATRIDAHERRHRRLSRNGPPALAAACVLSVLALVLTAWLSPAPSGGGPAERPIAASAPAVTALRTVATAAVALPATSVRADQYAYVRSLVISNEGAWGDPAVLGPPHEREIWLGQDPSSSGGRHDVIREFGQDWPIQWTGPFPVGVYRPTYAWLASLPADPDRLLDTLENALEVPTDEEPEQRLFRVIGDLIREQVVPPRTARALFLATMRIRGVHLEHDVTDAAGRHGFGITRTDAVYHTSSTWIFDPRTHVLLGTKDYFVARDGTRTLFNATAVLDRGIADRAGEAPSAAAHAGAA